MITNDVGNNLNRVNVSYVQVQITNNSSGKTHQNLLSRRMNRIQHEEIPVIDPPMELCIGTNNQPELTISTGVIQDQKSLKSPMMEEVIVITTAYNGVANRNPQRISRTGVDGSTLVTSGNRAVVVSGIIYVCPSPPPFAPPYVILDSSIGNIRQNNTPKLRDTNELNAHINRNLTNDPIVLSVSGKILVDEFSDSSSCDL